MTALSTTLLVISTSLVAKHGSCETMK
ncbi:UNVERIFIED_CONTAM: hypothetical protein GTU68_066137 [Idotea baltica]|nr:hypothetical protein [Idotea baltica]